MRIAIGLSIFLFCLAAFAGWVVNIIDLVHTHVLSGLAVLRVVGIFIPVIGSLLGWFAH